MSDNETPNEDPGIIAYMFSNDTKNGVERMMPMLKMFYRGLEENTIGLMEVLDTDTGHIELVLVGVEHDDEGLTNTYPLAKILKAPELSRYEMPDGKGGWISTADLSKEIEDLAG